MGDDESRDGVMKVALSVRVFVAGHHGCYLLVLSGRVMIDGGGYDVMVGPPSSISPSVTGWSAHS